ncbi:heme-dependent oxidative N-demethylase family protein [Shimia sp.]|uniref:heme-dependent oxidative N-demethylase family protein n=1 Tax=Shimia sp. TaxID=1954381 RepID=UPI003B8A9D0E
MDTILQKHMPFDPLQNTPLPGVAPLAMSDWLIIDDAYAPQMALRRRLLANRRQDVLQVAPQALPAAQELLSLVLEQLAMREDFDVSESHVTCADGHRVTLIWDDPMQTVGQLVQEDMCLLQKQGDEHVLTGAVLCFPAGWTLSEKFQKSLLRIHAPVSEYDENIAKRVQRLFDGVRPGRPLWRKNALWYDDPCLFAPRSEATPHLPARDPGTHRPFLRSERQSFVRLPKSQAVVFSIHTFVLRREDASFE